MNSNFKICAYYTSKYYDTLHEYLLPSVQALELDYFITEVPDLGSWSKNTSFKPQFAFDMLRRNRDKNIILIDVDARIEQYPSLFEVIPDDVQIAAHYLDNNEWYRNGNKTLELLTGTLFLRNNEAIFPIIFDWMEECENNERKWEQKVLQEVIEKRKVKTFNLPLSYCYITSLPNNNTPHVIVDNPVITHHQASRTLRNG